MMQKWDGHTHTQFCPHGSGKDLNAHLSRAVALNFDRYSVTEHSPLPKGWMPEEALATLAMSDERLPSYFAAAQGAKSRYAGEIEVLIGLELDYLPGREDHTLSLLENHGDQLQEAIVSVHYLPGKTGMHIVNYTAEYFIDNLVEYYGSVDLVVNEYFDQVEAAIDFARQLPLPTRIGHPSLIETLRLAVPGFNERLVSLRLRSLPSKLKAANVGVDVNTGGMRRETCRRPFAPAWFVLECASQGIECIFGSDAHSPSEVGSGWEWFQSLFQGGHGGRIGG